jgi:hypothetical protein
MFNLEKHYSQKFISFAASMLHKPELPLAA